MGRRCSTFPSREAPPLALRPVQQRTWQYQEPATKEQEDEQEDEQTRHDVTKPSGDEKADRVALGQGQEDRTFVEKEQDLLMTAIGRLLTLVCEGSCGAPHIGRYDEAVKALHNDKPKDVAIMHGRNLVHTPHESIASRGDYGRAIFRCAYCGTERVFGWPSSGAHGVSA